MYSKGWTLECGIKLLSMGSDSMAEQRKQRQLQELTPHQQEIQLQVLCKDSTTHVICIHVRG